MQYRHELKFLISQGDMERIDARLECLMQRDIHQSGSAYTVRSLYFDDWLDSCLEEVLSGVDDRKKYRLRLYDGDTSLIHLEKKSKRRGMTRKESEGLSAEDCLAYMEGLPVPGSTPLTQELFAAMIRKGMVPKCIVEYERRAYVEPAGNVRITLDMDIRGTADTRQFLEPLCQGCTYVLPEGMHILEVKYDEFLPDHLLQAIDLNNLQRSSFSKYAYVRNCTNIREGYL